MTIKRYNRIYKYVVLRIYKITFSLPWCSEYHIMTDACENPRHAGCQMPAHVTHDSEANEQERELFNSVRL